MLLLPGVEGCTIITDGGYCTCMGMPHDVVKQLFYKETKIKYSKEEPNGKTNCNW